MNFFDFSGGMVSRKSPYLMKDDQVPDISNLEIEKGGLTLRSGTKKLYGPFLGKVKSIQKALSSCGKEILFVQTENGVEMVFNGTHCRQTLTTKDFRVLSLTDGFGFVFSDSLYRMHMLFCRSDGEIKLENPGTYLLMLEQLESDYTTDSQFPADLYGCNIIDSTTGTLYHGVSHTDANPENIHGLLQTDAFFSAGRIGDLVILSYTSRDIIKVKMNNVYFTQLYLSVSAATGLINLFAFHIKPIGIPAQALACPYLVWHPASMRFFAAGNPEYPTALYISEPNDWCSFLESNILYPHLHLGNITGLSVVEKSVVVCYEYGWSHYVGSDPTDDAQWSLLSVPDGTRFGKTVCLTPGSVTFFSGGELMSFSSSMLTVQMLYSPSGSLYKFLTKDKIRIPNPFHQAFAHYMDGNYYLVIDDKMYVYHHYLSAFTCYEGLNCTCLQEDYSGRLLMGRENCIVTFFEDCSYDYDPKTNTNQPISYRVTIPVLGAARENEVARCTEVVIKTRRLSHGGDCTATLFSEKQSCSGKLCFNSRLQYGVTDWNKQYRDSYFSETVFPWQVSGNLFFLELEGISHPEEAAPVAIYNVYLEFKKERNKL